MAKRQSEGAAASLLTAWTDVDTAMQIVGTNLGVFRPGPLDPTSVLERETPLRNALFDILLSLVEGGALEIRVAADNRYAFRWREDIAVAGLAPGGSGSIDLAAPSPYLAELRHAQAERDAALARAEVAEALAAERERLLRLDDRPPIAIPDATAPDPPAAVEPEPEPARAELHDVLYLTPPAPEAEPEIDLTLEPAEPIEAIDEAEAVEEVTAEVVDLTDAAAVEEEPARRPKWSGYAIDRSRTRLTSVDRLAEDG